MLIQPVPTQEFILQFSCASRYNWPRFYISNKDSCHVSPWDKEIGNEIENTHRHSILYVGDCAPLRTMWQLWWREWLICESSCSGFPIPTAIKRKVLHHGNTKQTLDLVQNRSHPSNVQYSTDISSSISNNLVSLQMLTEIMDNYIKW